MKRARGPMLVSTAEAVAYVRDFMGVKWPDEQIEKRIRSWAQQGVLLNCGHSGPGGALWSLKSVHRLVEETMEGLNRGNKRRRTSS